MTEIQKRFGYCLERKKSLLKRFLLNAHSGLSSQLKNILEKKIRIDHRIFGRVCVTIYHILEMSFKVKFENICRKLIGQFSY
jgi:hypothetical protein